MQITSPETGFSNEHLVALDWVFAAVCEAVEAEQGKLDGKAKTRIAEQLTMLASNAGAIP